MSADQRTLAGAPAVLRWQPTDGDGQPADPGGTVTVSVVNALGDTLAVDQATSGATTEERTYTLSAALNGTVDRLTATWSVGGVTAAVTTIDVTGAQLFTIAELRAEETAVGNETNYPTSRLIEIRKEVEEFFEERCARSFVPVLRVERSTVECARSTLVLKRPDLRAVRRIRTYWPGGGYVDTDLTTITGESYGVLRGMFAGDVEVIYECGLTAPRDVKRAGWKYARIIANPQADRPDRATSLQTETGSYALATAGMRGSITGYPEIDEVLKKYRQDVAVA